MTPNVCANSAVIWDNWSGKDERPAASTAGRSSHSDSLARKEGVASMIATPGTVVVPIPRIDSPCGQHSPKTNRPCRRADGHTGRHAFIWQHVEPGRVREVWR